MSVVLMFVGNILFNALGNILMKSGSNAIGDLNVRSFQSILNNIILNFPLVSGVMCYGLSLVFYVFVLQKVNLSVAYPIIVSCSVIIVNVASKLIFHENILWTQIAGCVVIVFGIFLIVKQ